MYFTPEEIIIKLKKFIKKIEQMQADMKDNNIDITPAQARIIYPILKDEKGYTMQELAEKVGVDKALVSRTIADLESKGIIEREKKLESSERNYKILLSEEHRKLYNKQLEKHKCEFEKFHSRFTKEEITNFISVINKLMNEKLEGEENA